MGGWAWVVRCVCVWCLCVVFVCASVGVSHAVCVARARNGGKEGGKGVCVYVLRGGGGGGLLDL